MNRWSLGALAAVFIGVGACSGSTATLSGADGGASSSGGSGSSSGVSSGGTSGGTSTSSTGSSSGSTSSTSGSTSSSGSTTSSSGASTSSSGSTTSSSGASTSSSGAPLDGGGTSSSGSSDAATEASGDDATVADAGIGIDCGVFTCTLTQVCCVSPQGNQVVTSCSDAPVCPDPRSTTLHCESTDDCNGPTVCCLGQSNHSAVATCQTTCGGGDAQLCDPNATDPGCPQGQQCQSPNGGGVPPLPGGVGVCG